MTFDEWWDRNYRDFTGVESGVKYYARLAWNAASENIPTAVHHEDFDIEDARRKHSIRWDLWRKFFGTKR